MDEVNLNLDHIVVFVDDMDSARQAWGVAGFTVTAGGEHALMGTTDALVVFLRRVT